ncbi:peptidase M36 [Dokdonia pacifica]|uniref:Por secretion system C-terminal sorting domain-containing protein n=1 Tax=Dokdonia pacifica TaxID=1627892 RepID=A0A238VZF5_9FLAO|nr:T9SS-dependent M36 family metallopeptidase [Dokdonia pacifica]GGG16358.1 peptidase M36 [Dokdonia pacifica]SNR39547.1 Por secretion system C-terminal sorting domain-containing protein [Dokdonia pacifica]
MLKLYKLTVFVCVFAFAALTNAQDYGTIITDHLESNRNTLGITDQDISDLTIKDEVFSQKSATTHVYAIQKINNIEVYNGGVSVAFKDGSIIYLANNLQKDIASRVNAVTPVLSPIQAASNAANSLGLGSSNFSLNQTISSQEFVLTQGGVSLEEVPVRLVYQATEDNALKLAWDLSIHTTDSKHWYSVRIDALNGELLHQNDWVVSCTFESHNHDASNASNNEAASFSMTQDVAIANELLAGEQYNVFPMPIESPNHGGESLETDPQDLVASPFGWHDTNGAEGAEFTITRGNNVWAQDDINANNGVGESPDGGEELNFDFDYNFDTAPVNMLDAVTTNLFYWNNIIHDVFYQYGFDEESGNFQENNYGNGGIGSDSVNADSQDGGGLNNANFGTPPDGGNPRMQMFLWSASGPPGEPLTINGGTLDGGYSGVGAGFGAQLPEDTPLVGDLALVQDDDAGDSTDPIDACDTITNGADLDGKIVVIRRGSCEFGVKVLAAEDEGAIAVIMVNNVPDAPFAMGAGAVGGQVTIPSIMVSQADGEAIIAALEGGEEINVSLLNDGPFQLDGSLDNGIIVHEYGHGISNRLTGGPAAAGCLGNAEQMGEGWSDYFGLVLTMTPEDTAEQGRGIGTYAIGQPITGQGIRPARYSTDFSVNPLTYDDVNNPNISQPHGIGTVWATMLWDMTWAFIDQYGFDADVYNGTGGNNIAIQLVMDGLKLQPCSPGFLDGRDAIIAAVEINTLIPEDEKDFAVCTIWNVFANRGAGFSAVQGSSNNRFDQEEAFDLPADVIENCEQLLSVNENDLDSVFSVYPNPSNGEITVSVAGTFGEGQILIYDINGREVYNKPATLEGNVSVNAAGLSRGVYIMNITSDSSSHTTKLIIE